jgi:hypothetical protein
MIVRNYARSSAMGKEKGNEEKGKGNWERHIIVSVQPEDATVKAAVESLHSKPVREQWQERQAMELKALIGRKLRPTDKVYLVGHGGESTLGGMDPTELALTVRKSLERVCQVNLVMCGTPGSNNADVFATLLRDSGCQAAVYAYAAPLAVKKNGEKLADDLGLGHLGIEEVLSRGREVKCEFAGPQPVPGEKTVADD